MEEWAKVKRHVAQEITLLCPEHHREKTAGRLPAELVREANKTPFNLRNGITKPKKLYFFGSEGEIKIGKLIWPFKYTGDDIKIGTIIIDGFELMSLQIENNNYLFNMTILNEKRERVLSIRENELVYSVGFWDIEFVGKTLTLRNSSRDIFMEIKFESSSINIVKGVFYCPGLKFDITNKEMLIYPIHRA